jgi:hypothetical protein
MPDTAGGERDRGAARSRHEDDEWLLGIFNRWINPCSFNVGGAETTSEGKLRRYESRLSI